MKQVKQEIIFIAIYAIICILAALKIPYMDTVAIISYVVLFGLMVYSGSVSTDFKHNIFENLFSIYYKLLYAVAILFWILDFPGKEIVYGASILFSLLYLLLVACSKKFVTVQEESIKTGKNLILWNCIYSMVFNILYFIITIV